MASNILDNPNARILVVGAFSQDPAVYTYATSFYTTLQALARGRVYSFNTRQQLLVDRLPSALTTRLAALLINQQLLKATATLKPTLVFIIKGEQIFASTLRSIKTTGTQVINFYPDNPFVLWNGNSTVHVLESLPLLDCMPFWSPELFPALHMAGCANTCFFPFAYDSQLLSPTASFTAQQLAPYTSQVCFVGTWEPEREQQLVHLREQLPQLDLAIWGNLWAEKAGNGLLKKNIRGPAIYGTEMIKAFKASKIVLNFIRQQNSGAHNMRTIEVPACGAFLLTERTLQQAQTLFTEDKMIGCFENNDELVAKIKFYLQSDQRMLYEIAKSGFIHAQNYTLENQLRRYFTSCPHIAP